MWMAGAVTSEVSPGLWGVYPRATALLWGCLWVGLCVSVIDNTNQRCSFFLFRRFPTLFVLQAGRRTPTFPVGGMWQPWPACTCTSIP